VEEREAVLSTGIGFGVAIPHARSPADAGNPRAARQQPAGVYEMRHIAPIFRDEQANERSVEPGKSNRGQYEAETQQQGAAQAAIEELQGQRPHDGRKAKVALIRVGKHEADAQPELAPLRQDLLEDRGADDVGRGRGKVVRLLQQHEGGIGQVALVALGRLPAAEAQTKDDTLVYALQSDVDSWDPPNSVLREAIILGYHVFDHLAVRDLKTRRVVPNLALSWKAIDDTTWEVKLRQGVKFHDGSPFTARDVKASFERVLDPAKKMTARGNHAKIKSVEMIDDYTVRFYTDGPYPIFVERLTALVMASEKVIKEKGHEWMQEHPVGTGPYKLVKWDRKHEHLLVRNDEYWGPKAHYKHVRIRIIPEQATQIAELISGGVAEQRRVPARPVERVGALAQLQRAGVGERPEAAVFDQLLVHPPEPASVRGVHRDAQGDSLAVHATSRGHDQVGGGDQALRVDRVLGGDDRR